MAAAPLTDAERQRVAYHLGYPALTTAASIQFGQPALSQTNFLVYSALQPGKLLDSAVEQVRNMSQVMDNIETKLIEAQDHLAAEKIEELTLRKDETDRLEGEYRRWGYRLAETIGAPIYPYSRRYMGGGNMVMNVPRM